MAVRKDMAVVAAMMVLALQALASTASAAAAPCNAGLLAACASPVMTGSKPSAACCSNLRAQQGCFCQFAKNPIYGRYIQSPYTRQTVSTCGIALPHC
ncbi:hypothetical protein ACQJBY_073483 [Aegilops geniculata]